MLSIVAVKVKGKIRRKIKARAIPTAKMSGRGVCRDGMAYSIAVNYRLSGSRELCKTERFSR